MAQHADPRPGHDGPATGLRALADLVNDVLTGWGALGRPAFAGPMLASSALETTSGRRRPSPSPGARPGPSGDGRRENHLGRPPRPAPHDDPPDHADDAVDDSHAETWLLVRRAQEGDGEAFGQLYDRYVDTVFRFIYYRVNDRALAEDFTSETFLRALRRIGTISYQGRDIGAWFITIARNIVLDHLKSARHRLETTTADTIEGPDQAQSTESAVLDQLQSERLMQAVGQLGTEQRECVMLRFVHGLSVSETAGVMGKNDGAIKALQHRAVRKLAELVGGELR
jgi:RNA polymerase sigma-70 factor (ECF subfamily)